MRAGVHGGGDVFDVVVVGGGPAGLSAALILGRCRRRVLVCDAGHPRNAKSYGIHGFLSRDGTPPAELLECARQQLRPYENVTVRFVEVVDAEHTSEGFAVILEDSSCCATSKLLLATGVVDELPAIPGIERFYGRSVHPCPYCDGWEWREQPLAVYGRGEKGSGLALMLTLWSRDLVLCTDGPAELSPAHRERLALHQIAVREEPIARLEGTEDGLLRRVAFANGEALARRAMFFNTGERQKSPLIAKLGCKLDARGRADTSEFEESNVPGLYIVGDASGDVQLAIVAAAEGARAAVAINKALLREASLI
jgi:thioredoxin reductase